jgi:hypothetical protein
MISFRNRVREAWSLGAFIQVTADTLTGCGPCIVVELFWHAFRPSSLIGPSPNNERPPNDPRTHPRNINTKLLPHAWQSLVLIGPHPRFIVTVNIVDGESLGTLEPCITARSDLRKRF